MTASRSQPLNHHHDDHGDDDGDHDGDVDDHHDDRVEYDEQPWRLQ